MEMSENRQNRPDLAAALFCTLGASMPHPYESEKEAQELAAKLPEKGKRLLKIIELCAPYDTPEKLYITAKAYSWLGTQYRKKTIEYSTKYLETEGWKELPHSALEEDGIMVSQASRVRASVYADLAQAQQEEKNYSAALNHFLEAYRLEPYNAMYAIKAADILVETHGKQEAVDFLNRQKLSRYYTPVKYLDLRGARKTNDTFQRVLDAHILKLEG